MTAAARSAPLRARLALVRGTAHGGRAAAFRAAQLGEQIAEPDFATLAALPDWLLWSDADQVQLAKVVALLMHRSGIDHELSGSKLAALSDAVGEDIFDLVCEAVLPASVGANHVLPRPEDIESIGRDIMNRALPLHMASRYVGAIGDGMSASHCRIAADLLLEAKRSS